MSAYRYAWVPDNSSTPTPAGSPFSGYLDFATATGSITNMADLNAKLVGLQFTSNPSTASSSSGGPLPVIPSKTYTKEDLRQLDPNSSLNLAWDGKKLSSSGPSISFTLAK